MNREECPSCGLLLPAGKVHIPRDGKDHDCIRALRDALLKQKKAAELLSFEVTTRCVAILEELVLRPDVGIAYFETDLEGQKRRVDPARVSGIFAVLMKKFKEMGEWSPLRAAERGRDDALDKIDKLPAFVEYCVKHMGPAEARRAIELATQLGVPRLDRLGL